MPLISCMVGAISIIFYLVFTKQTVSLSGLKTMPLYNWVGGALGAFYVTVIILACPRIGLALAFGLVIAGQMFMSVLLDHLNILVAQRHSINSWRIIGILMVIVGVLIIRKF